MLDVSTSLRSRLQVSSPHTHVPISLSHCPCMSSRSAITTRKHCGPTWHQEDSSYNYNRSNKTWVSYIWSLTIFFFLLTFLYFRRRSCCRLRNRNAGCRCRCRCRCSFCGTGCLRRVSAGWRRHTCGWHCRSYGLLWTVRRCHCRWSVRRCCGGGGNRERCWRLWCCNWNRTINCICNYVSS